MGQGSQPKFGSKFDGDVGKVPQVSPVLVGGGRLFTRRHEC